VEELSALGARVTVAAVDVADRHALEQVIEAIPSDVPLRGVIHAAGVLDDGVLPEQTAERFAQADRSLDLVSCRVAAHHFSDPATFLRESARVLVPGGRLGLAVWGHQEENAGFRAMGEVLAKHLREKISKEAELSAQILHTWIQEEGR